MRKIITFCASFVFLLAVSGGAKAMITATNFGGAGEDLGSITETKFFGNSFTIAGAIISNPFAFDDVYEFTVPGGGSIATNAEATSFNASGQNIATVDGPAVGGVPTIGFKGHIYIGDFSTTEVLSQVAFDAAAAGTVYFDLLGGPVGCVVIGGGDCEIIFPSTPVVTGVQHFLRFLGTANGFGQENGTFGTYSGEIAVPLPPAAILFLSALAGLAGFSRIRRRKAVTT